MGVEPTTTSLEGCTAGDVSVEKTEVTTGDTAACTNACTSEAQNTHETPADAQADTQGEGTAQDAATPPAVSKAEGLDTLAQAIADLSADDRSKLAAMLAQGNGGKAGKP